MLRESGLSLGHSSFLSTVLSSEQVCYDSPKACSWSSHRGATIAIWVHREGLNSVTKEGNLLSFESTGPGPRGLKAIGGIRLEEDGISWQGTDRGSWRKVPYNANASEWLQVTLTLTTVQTGRALPLHCESKLYLNGQLQSTAHDTPGEGLGCAVPEMRSAAIQLRLGSIELSGSHVRDLFLFGRCLRASEVLVMSKRTPYITAWAPKA